MPLAYVTGAALFSKSLCQPGIDQLLRIAQVRRQKHIEWRAVLDLRGQRGRCLVRSLGMNPCSLFKLRQDRRQHRLQVRCRGHVQLCLRAP